MSAPQPTDLGRASRSVAALVVLASAIGFAFDSVVILTLGAGRTTDAYFLALGVVLFAPTVFYLTATNVLVPLLARRGADGTFARSEWVFLALVGTAASLVLWLLRNPLAIALSGGDSGDGLRAALAILSLVPLFSAVSEVLRARLLAAGRYAVTGGYLVARNAVTVLAAMLVRPDTVEKLALCTTLGYLAQTVVVLLLSLVRSRGGTMHSRSERGDLARGLGMQAALFGIGYLPVVLERTIAQRLGEGLPTLFGYSYRIVSMIGAVAITSATVPAMRELGLSLHSTDPAGLGRAVRDLYAASARLAVPATALLLVGALPLGLVLAPEFAGRFTVVLSLYTCSVLFWVLVRPWTALAYAQFAVGPVFGVTVLQCLVAAALQVGALRAGWPILAAAPPLAALAAAFAAARIPLRGRDHLLDAVRKSSSRWIGSITLCTLTAGAIPWIAAPMVSNPRNAGLLAGALAALMFGVTSWTLGVWTRPVLKASTAR